MPVQRAGFVNDGKQCAGLRRGREEVRAPATSAFELAQECRIARCAPDEGREVRRMALRAACVVVASAVPDIRVPGTGPARDGLDYDISPPSMRDG
jgi:hypothetical protein